MTLRIQIALVVFVAIALAIGTRAAAQQGGCPGWTSTSDLNGTTVTQSVCGDIHVQGKIDGGSTVTLTSTSGSITIDGKIDGGSTVILNAPAGDIRIGVVGGDGDKKIDGGSKVSAFSGGKITLGNKIDGCQNVDVTKGCTAVFFRAANGIDIGNKIDGGVSVRLCTANGSIEIHDKIDNSSTTVYYWPSGSIQVDGGQQGGSKVNVDQRVACLGLGTGFPQYPL